MPYVMQLVLVALIWLWLLALLGSFLTMMLAVFWIVISSPRGVPPGKGLVARWITDLDDVGEILTGGRLAKTRRVLMGSACVFLSLALFGGAFALLKKVAG